MNEFHEICFLMAVLSEINNTKGEGSAAKKQHLVADAEKQVTTEGLFDFVMRTAFDPQWVTHISKIDVNDTVVPSDGYPTFRELVGRLMSVRAVNNVLRSETGVYVGRFPVENREMLVKVLTKAINIGLGVSSINKALGRVLIQDIEIMKAESEIKQVAKWFADGEEVWAEMKYDGIRGFAECLDGKVKSVKTYNFSELDIDVMTNIAAQLNSIAPYFTNMTSERHFFFDFEITGKERQAVSGEVNKLIKGTAVVGCDKNWQANIFDNHPWSIFNGVPSKTSYLKRRYILENVVGQVSAELLPNVTVAERWQVRNIGELMALFNKVLEMGCEGLVVKCGSGVYEMKRSLNWIKMKAEIEADLKVVGWYAGEKGTKREATIGGFTCTTSDGKIVVNVGSGFTDKMLAEIMQNGPDSYIGTIVEVRFNAIITKQDSDIKSLFLPRFKRPRPDKNTADSLEQVQKKVK